jgi:RNA polymerase sigma-54 factor
MSLAPRLDLRQTQSLVMTPQLQQAIRLLALSNVELEAAIGEELEKNPLLEAERDDSGDFDIEPLGESATPSGESEDVWLDAPEGGSSDSLDVDMTAETFHHDSIADSGMGSGDGGSSGGGEDVDFDSFAADAPGLGDHLLQQAGSKLDGVELAIARALIDQIDEAGYLRADILEMAMRLGVPRGQVEAVLSVVQSFDPTGVAARTLGECLALQAKEADRHDPAMARLLMNLDLLAEGRLPQLRRICGVDEEDMTDMIRELRGYDPKPGLRFGSTRVDAVVPDVFVVRRGKGWAVEINGGTLPKLLVNQRYHAELTASGDKVSKSWANDCLASANWLVKALDQRQRTIIRVATEIVKHQDGFFREGVSQLRPLTLRVIADEIEMHESTVSRVTSNKYLQCERGLFELKYFFTSGVASADGGENVSAEAVKNAIRALISGEGDDILSDDTLVDLLRDKGFDLARRTVAKYREAIGIGSSVQRRRARALGRAA